MAEAAGPDVDELWALSRFVLEELRQPGSSLSERIPACSAAAA